MKDYEPTFMVEIDGKELPEDISDKVESFQYEDHEDKMDELKVSIVDLNLLYCDHPMLQEGKEIRVKWGYIGNLSELRTCTIKAIDYSFSDDGTVRISLTGYDKSHKLTGRAARTCWSNKNIEDIVKDIAKKHNLSPIVEIPSDASREFLSQGGKNDFVFLKGLAAEMGCKTWVVNDELHFEPNEDKGNASYEFRFREDADGMLKSFSITSNAEKGKGTGKETEVAGIDPVTKKPFQEKTNAPEEKVAVNLENDRENNETPLQPKDDEAGLVKATPSATASQAKQEASGRVKSEGMGTVEADAETIGIPGLKAKDIIRIEGISKKFSGLWRVKSVRHSITDGGYGCGLSLVRSDTNAGSAQVSKGGKTPANNDQKSAPGNSNNQSIPATAEANVG
jgi:phage protein D